MPSSGASRSRVRVARHRTAMRRKGMREIRLWVPDARAPGFLEELVRQCRAVEASPVHGEVMDLLEGAWDDLDAPGPTALATGERAAGR